MSGGYGREENSISRIVLAIDTDWSSLNESCGNNRKTIQRILFVDESFHGVGDCTFSKVIENDIWNRHGLSSF